MNSIAIKFSFKVAEYNSLGLIPYNSFMMAQNDFKRYLTGIVIHKKKEQITKVYIFSDNSSCIYNQEFNFFSFKTNTNETAD